MNIGSFMMAFGGVLGLIRHFFLKNVSTVSFSMMVASFALISVAFVIMVMGLLLLLLAKQNKPKPIPDLATLMSSMMFPGMMPFPTNMRIVANPPKKS